MAFRSHRTIHVLFAAALMSGAAGCDAPAAPAETRAENAVPSARATFVLDPAASNYDLSSRCDVPVSSTVVLEDGQWRRETRWAPGCREGLAPGEGEVFSAAGRFELRGDTITLHGSAPAGFEGEEEEGILSGETLTIWGHCDGEDVFVRKT